MTWSKVKFFGGSELLQQVELAPFLASDPLRQSVTKAKGSPSHHRPFWHIRVVSHPSGWSCGGGECVLRGVGREKMGEVWVGAWDGIIYIYIYICPCQCCFLE